MKYKTLESAAEAAVAQAKLHSLVDALYQGDKLSSTADQLAAFIKAPPYLDEICWQELDDVIRFLLRNRLIPSDPSSFNRLLGAYLENHPMETPETSYDIAAFCFFYPNVINSLLSIYLQFLDHNGWVQVEFFGKAHYEYWKGIPIYCDADAIKLCEALFYYGVLPKRRAMRYFDFPEEEQKAVALGRIRAFSEVKAQKLR